MPISRYGFGAAVEVLLLTSAVAGTQLQISVISFWLNPIARNVLPHSIVETYTCHTAPNAATLPQAHATVPHHAASSPAQLLDGAHPARFFRDVSRIGIKCSQCIRDFIGRRPVG